LLRGKTSKVRKMIFGKQGERGGTLLDRVDFTGGVRTVVYLPGLRRGLLCHWLGEGKLFAELG